MAYTPQQIIEIAEVSEYLAGNDVSLGQLFGGRLDPRLPVMLYMERKAIQWMYNLSPNNSTLPATSNYLYSICYKSRTAWNIISGGSGGSIPPITPPQNAPAPYYFEVTDSSFLVNGQSIATIANFTKYNLIYTRNGIPQSQVNTELSYFTWNPTTAQFISVPAVVTGELIGLIPV